MFKPNKRPSKKIISDFKAGKLEYRKQDSIYSVFSEYYDDIMSDIDYKSWFCYLQAIFNEFGVNPSKILDIACGTAPTLIQFSKDGYDTCGVDISPGMIRQARKKYDALNLHGKLHLGDMTKYKSDEKFHIVYLLNDSINYLMTLEDLSNFFYTTYDLLEEGGLLIFDASTELNIIKNFSGKIYKEYDTFSFFWCNDYISSTRFVVSYLDFLIYETLEVFREIHLQNIFTEEQILQGASAVGFNEIKVYHGFTFDKPHEYSDILHFVMRK